MSDTTIQYKIEVMQAYEECKEIEYRLNTWDEGVWKPISIPSWNWYEVDYRVKQEKKEKPSIDWDQVHSDFKWLAIDGDDNLPFLYIEKPVINRYSDLECWTCTSNNENDGADAIGFASYEPGNVDWKDSLVERP